MSFKETLQKKTKEAEEIVLQYLPKEEGFAAQMAQALNYNMTAPGKRLRPVLMMEAYRMYQGEGTLVHPFMAAMEMIHTHSLIHDDLPALDNDDYRRGRKTTHKVYGEAMAVLCGDTLLNYAYETAFLAFDMDREGKRTARALQILGKKAGLYGMLGGQSVDVMNDGIPLPRQMLVYIYENNTSALIEGSLMIGAVLANASAEEVDRMEQAGRYLGLAFQIQDDILDVTGTKEELGKPIRSDEKNEKTTYVSLEGIEKAREEAEKLTGKAQKLLTGNHFLQELLAYLMNRKK